MIRFAALLVAASVLAVSIPAAADGVPREKRPVVTKKIKKHRVVGRKVAIEKKVIVEKQRRRRSSLAPAAAPAACPATPVYIWAPGHWTWNSPMNMHVWVPGMYIRPLIARGRAEPRAAAHRPMDRRRSRRLIACVSRFGSGTHRAASRRAGSVGSRRSARLRARPGARRNYPGMLFVHAIGGPRKRATRRR